MDLWNNVEITIGSLTQMRKKQKNFFSLWVFDVVDEAVDAAVAVYMLLRSYIPFIGEHWLSTSKIISINKTKCSYKVVNTP